MADVFISYSQADREWVKQLATAFEAEGLSVWWDPNLVAGARYRETIDNELEQAQAVVVVWSNMSVHSDYVCDEAEDARVGNKLVPVLKDPVRVPAGFRQLQTTDLSQWRGRRESPEFRRAIDGIRAFRRVNPDPTPKTDGGDTSTVVGESAVPPRQSRRPSPPPFVEPRPSISLRNFPIPKQYIVPAAILTLLILVGIVAKIVLSMGSSTTGTTTTPTTVVDTTTPTTTTPTDTPPSTTTTPTETPTSAPVNHAGLNSQVLESVLSAEQSERDARDRASKARVRGAAAESVAGLAREAVDHSRAAWPGYSKLAGKYDNGNDYVYEGHVVDGKADGYGVLDVAATGYHYEGQWTTNQQAGLGLERFRDGSTYTGEFSGGTKSGLGTYVYAGTDYAGDYYAGEWLAGKQVGLGVYKHKSNGELDAGQEDNSLGEGYGVNVFADGSRWEGHWHQNKLDGLAAKFDKNGNVTEQGTYEAGALKSAMSP